MIAVLLGAALGLSVGVLALACGPLGLAYLAVSAVMNVWWYVPIVAAVRRSLG